MKDNSLHTRHTAFQIHIDFIADLLFYSATGMDCNGIASNAFTYSSVL